MDKIYCIYNPYADNHKGRENANDILFVYPEEDVEFSDITKIEFTYYSNGSVLYWVYSNRRIFALDSSNAGTNLFLTRAKQFGITIE